MRYAYLPNRKTNQTDPIPCYCVNEFPYNQLQTSAQSFSRGHQKETYQRNIATFDIETTTDEHTEIAWMYHWHMCIDGICAYGRTWKEWETFLQNLKDLLNLSQERKLAIYVHNLGFEYQFMKAFLRRSCGDLKIFAPQKRKPLRVNVDGFEFRCSWKLSNMTLEKFLENEHGVSHTKMSGDLDYRIIRTPKTKLTDKEFSYCIGDVLGLYEAIVSRLEADKDTLMSIPMTSTGYPRRDCRNASRKQNGYREMFHRNAITKTTYTMLREAARGGDTHANRRYSGRIIEDVDCYDVQSSYPYIMMTKKYPMTAFTPYGEIETHAELEELLQTKACLFRWTAVGVHIKDGYGMPYIPDSKCRQLVKGQIDNGRVLNADGLSMTLTEHDYRIIKKQYDIDEEYVLDMHTAELGKLPKCIRDVIMEYYRAKCELKVKKKELEKQGIDTSDIEYLYDRSKNKLNGIFGMCYTDPVHEVISECEDGSWKAEMPDIDEALEKYNKSRNSFLVYSWGVWTTAHARAHLDRLREAAGEEGLIYQDTDSEKGVNIHHERIEAENRKIRKECEEYHAYCDVGGERYYLGEYEREDGYKRFKTLGSKKYAYDGSVPRGGEHKKVKISGVNIGTPPKHGAIKKRGIRKLHVTVSGVNKGKAPAELGKLDNFRLGFVFREAGGLELKYFESDITDLKINDETIETASGIAMLPSTYTIGITRGYDKIIGLDPCEI